MDTTERLHFDFSLPCIGEGNGNPLQYSCLENPRDGGARWAAVYGVAQSQTRLKRLSSSSSSSIHLIGLFVFSPITLVSDIFQFRDLVETHILLSFYIYIHDCVCIIMNVCIYHRHKIKLFYLHPNFVECLDNEYSG